MREQPEILELRQLGANRRRRDAQVGALDERLRADRLPGADELLDDAAEDRPLPFAELHCFLHLQEILAVAGLDLGSGDDLGRHPAAEEAAAPRERERLAAVDREAELLGARETFRVERRAEPAERQRLVEPEAEHHAFARPDLVVERLDLALGGRPAASASR